MWQYCSNVIVADYVVVGSVVCCSAASAASAAATRSAARRSDSTCSRSTWLLVLTAVELTITSCECSASFRRPGDGNPSNERSKSTNWHSDPDNLHSIVSSGDCELNIARIRLSVMTIAREIFGKTSRKNCAFLVLQTAADCDALNARDLRSLFGTRFSTEGTGLDIACQKVTVKLDLCGV